MVAACTRVSKHASAPLASIGGGGRRRRMGARSSARALRQRPTVSQQPWAVLAPYEGVYLLTPPRFCPFAPPPLVPPPTLAGLGLLLLKRPLRPFENVGLPSLSVMALRDSTHASTHTPRSSVSSKCTQGQKKKPIMWAAHSSACWVHPARRALRTGRRCAFHATRCTCRPCSWP